MQCKDIIIHIEKLCPRGLAEDWDNVGLLVGNPEQEIKKVMTALDAIDEVIEEAISNGADMIVTHHPLFNPNWNQIRNITTESSLGRVLHKLIRNNISLYCAHTNLDIAKGGINDLLVELLELQNASILDCTGSHKLKKLVVFVPESHAELVRDAICSAGGGFLGNYSDCSFETNGVGNFRPREGANPYIGTIGELESVKECRIETVFDAKMQTRIIESMLKAHPYEEVAYDIYPLDNLGEQYGIGRIGELKEEMTLMQFATKVKEKLNIPYIRVIGSDSIKIKKVALCSGSGMSLFDKVINSGVDVYLTGDVKYHDAQTALENGICVIDGGHYETENIIVPKLKEYISQLEGIEVIQSRVDANPFKVI